MSQCDDVSRYVIDKFKEHKPKVLEVLRDFFKDTIHVVDKHIKVAIVNDAPDYVRGVNKISCIRGWYDSANNTITIVLGEDTDLSDVDNVIVHELAHALDPVYSDSVNYQYLQECLRDLTVMMISPREILAHRVTQMLLNNAKSYNDVIVTTNMLEGGFYVEDWNGSAVWGIGSVILLNFTPSDVISHTDMMELYQRKLPASWSLTGNTVFDGSSKVIFTIHDPFTLNDVYNLVIDIVNNKRIINMILKLESIRTRFQQGS